MHSRVSQVSREIASQWINHRLGSFPLGSDLASADFEGFESAAGQLYDKLSTVTDSTQRILSKLQVASQAAGLHEMVEVVNAWLEAIQDPSYRKNWIESIHAHKNLDSKSKAQLLALLNDTGSEPETIFKRAIKRLLPRDNQEPIKLELFLMTAVPIDS
jgi:fibrillarin-like rRNA methylase